MHAHRHAAGGRRPSTRRRPPRAPAPQASGTVTCTLGHARQRRSSATVQITVTPQSRPARSPTRRASRPTSPTRTPPNNSASAATTVNPAADLSLTKTRLARPGAGGATAHLHARGHQRRARRARPACTVTDTLPGRRDVRLGDALAGHLLAVERDGHLRARHARERRRTRPSRSRSRRSRPGTITQPGERDLGRRRPGLAPTTRASAATTVNPAADLSLTKSDSPDPVLAGQLLTYTLTAAQRRARRPRPACQVTDTLPAGVTFDSATPSQGTCSQSSGTVTCALGTIANGQNATVDDQGPPAERRARSPTRRASPPTSSIRSRRTTPRAPTTTVTPAADLSLDEVRLARPGAGRRAPHLHAHGPQRRALERDRRAGLPTTCRPASTSAPRPRRRAAAPERAARSPARSGRSPSGQSATVDDQGPPAERQARSPTTRASPSDDLRPGRVEQLGERRPRRSTRPPTSRSRRPTRPTRSLAASS